MFRFVALFALVAVAFARPQPEADPQWLYHHGGPHYLGASLVNPVVPVVKPVVPVVKYIDPHHTEGMTKEGVPEKTDSVKIAEKHHAYLKAVEEAKKKFVVPYSAYYNHGVLPYYNYQYTVPHVVAKREAEAEADPQLFYNAYTPYVYKTYTAEEIKAKQEEYMKKVEEYNKKMVVPYTAYPYYNHGVLPYTTGYTYPYTYNYQYTVPHVVAKREAEGEADPALLYRSYHPYTYTGYTGYTYPYTTTGYTYPYTTGYTYPYTYGTLYGK